MKTKSNRSNPPQKTSEEKIMELIREEYERLKSESETYGVLKDKIAGKRSKMACVGASREFGEEYKKEFEKLIERDVNNTRYDKRNLFLEKHFYLPEEKEMFEKLEVPWMIPAQPSALIIQKKMDNDMKEREHKSLTDAVKEMADRVDKLEGQKTKSLKIGTSVEIDREKMLEDIETAKQLIIELRKVNRLIASLQPITTMNLDRNYALK